MTPKICGRSQRRAVLSVLTALGTVAALPAGAVTYLIDFTDDAGLVFGSFEAPEVGGR